MPCLFCETKQRADQIQKLRGFSRNAIFQFMPCLFCEAKQRAGNTVLPNKKKGRKNYVYQNLTALYFLCDYDRYRFLLQKTRDRCKRLCAGRPFGRPVADGLCLRHILFFRCYFHWICRAVRMEVRDCVYLDRDWKCSDRESAGMGGLGKADESYEPPPEVKDYAGLFR